MSRSKPSWLSREVGHVYSLHMVPPLTAPDGRVVSKHYTGFAREGNLARRLVDHGMRRGALLTRLQIQRGGSWIVAKVENGVTRDRETQLKESSASKHCKVCKAEKAFEAGKLTPAEALTKAGWDTANPHERTLLLRQFGLPEAPEGMASEPAPDVIEIRHPKAEPAPVSAEQMAEMSSLADGLIEQWRAELEFPKAPEYEKEMEMG